MEWNFIFGCILVSFVPSTENGVIICLECVLVFVFFFESKEKLRLQVCFTFLFFFPESGNELRHRMCFSFFCFFFLLFFKFENRKRLKNMSMDSCAANTGTHLFVVTMFCTSVLQSEDERRYVNV